MLKKCQRQRGKTPPAHTGPRRTLLSSGLLCCTGGYIQSCGQDNGREQTRSRKILVKEPLRNTNGHKE
jgi:hypothetical protein